MHPRLSGKGEGLFELFGSDAFCIYGGYYQLVILEYEIKKVTLLRILTLCVD